MQYINIIDDTTLDFNNPDKSGTGYVEFYVNLLVDPSVLTEYPADNYNLVLDGESNIMTESQNGSTMWKIWMGPSNKNLISLIVKKDGSAQPTLRIRTDGGVNMYEDENPHTMHFMAEVSEPSKAMKYIINQEGNTCTVVYQNGAFTLESEG